MPRTGTNAPAIAEARRALEIDGYATLNGALTPDALSEAEELLDAVVERATRLPAGSRGARFVRDMLPGDEPRLTSGWDQLEIEHAGALEPALLRTEVFRQCAALAQQISGRVWYSFDHFICKSPRNAAETPWHQDAAFMRMVPSRHRALHFWIPFQEATVDNGCLRFIPGSHRLPLLPHEPFARGAGSPGLQRTGVEVAQSLPCPVEPGGVAIHTPYTLHQAGRNTTDLPRKAWIVQFSPWGRFHLGLKRCLGRVPQPLGA